MEQLNNTVLVNAISIMKTLPEFNKFINLCKNRLSNFEEKKIFVYQEYDSKTKKIKNTNYNFSSDSIIKEYVSLLRINIKEIICCDSEGLLKWKKKFDEIKLNEIDETIIKGFNKRILQLLQYKTLRSGDGNLIFKFYKELKVKTCIYCNSQHVLLLTNSKKARLQADHNLPKAKYPHLSISLANLYPSCNNCNHDKKEEDVKYELYYVRKPKREIGFSLNPLDISSFYMNKKDENDLKIEFNQGKTKLEEVLHISEIYENHKDYAGDLLRNYIVYTPSYISKLTKSFPKLLGNNDKVLNRMIFGSTLDEIDINQRVFSKLTNDLKKQLDKMDFTKK